MQSPTKVDRLRHVEHELALTTSLLSAATERINAIFGAVPRPKPGHRDRVPVEFWNQLEHVTALIMTAEDGAAGLQRQLRQAVIDAGEPRPTTQIRIDGPAHVLHRR